MKIWGLFYFTPMHFLYILHSQTADKYYVGETADVDQRLKDHLTHKYSKSFTKLAEDWQVVLNFKVETRKEALFLEQFIKRMKNRRFIQKVIKDHSILEDILRRK
jgi:putative endonuclease